MIKTLDLARLTFNTLTPTVAQIEETEEIRHTFENFSGVSSISSDLTDPPTKVTRDEWEEFLSAKFICVDESSPMGQQQWDALLRRYGKENIHD